MGRGNTLPYLLWRAKKMRKIELHLAERLFKNTLKHYWWYYDGQRFYYIRLHRRPSGGAR